MSDDQHLYYILESIKELKEGQDKLQEEQISIRLELTVLRVKVTLWGIGASIITTGLISFIFSYISKIIKKNNTGGGGNP